MRRNAEYWKSSPVVHFDNLNPARNKKSLKLSKNKNLASPIHYLDMYIAAGRFSLERNEKMQNEMFNF